MATPSPTFPAAVATTADLKQAANLVQSALAVPVAATDTNFVVFNGSQFQANMLVSVDKEIASVASVSGNTLVIGARGFDGTTAAAHAVNASVSVFIDAWHHNKSAVEIEAIEAFLGPYGQNLTGSVTNASFIFHPQTPTGNLIVGSNVITLSPVPLGVNGTDQHHYLYISGGTGTPEAVLITGGTAVAGTGSGTLIVTCGNTHSGAWTIQTATSGIQEAIVALGAPGQVLVLGGQWIIHAPITIPAPILSVWQGYAIRGQGRLTTTLMIASDFPLTAQGVFIPLFNSAITYSGPGPYWCDFGVCFPQNYTLPISGMTHWPPVIRADCINMGKVIGLYVAGAWQAFVITGSTQTVGQWEFADIDVSGYGPGVFEFNGFADTIKFNRIHLWPFQNANPPTGDAGAVYNPAVVGLKIDSVISLIISDCYFLTGTAIQFTGAGAMAAITVVNTGFDVFGVINMSQPSGGVQMSITNCVFYQDTSAASFTAPSAMFVYGQTAPNLIVTSSTLYRGSATQALVSIQGPSGSNPAYGQVSFLGNLIYDSSNVASAAPLFDISNTTTAALRVKITDNQISYEGNLTYTNPMLRVTGTGTAVTFQNNTNAGYGSGVWISIANDDQHYISGNVISGPVGSWTVSLPTSRVRGYYQDQNFQYGPPAPIVNVSGPATVAASGYAGTYICNAAGGAVQINLPFASQSKGATFELKKTDSSTNAVSFVPASEAIEGVVGARAITTQYATITLVSDGVAWWLR